jgi:hypothetical protein
MRLIKVTKTCASFKTFQFGQGPPQGYGIKKAGGNFNRRRPAGSALGVNTFSILRIKI